MTLVLACLALTSLSAVREPLHVIDGRLREENADVFLKGLEITVDETAEKTQFPYRSARVALEDWNANCVEITVSPRAWMGKTDDQKDKGRSIQDSVEETVALMVHRKAFAILSLMPGGTSRTQPL